MARERRWDVADLRITNEQLVEYHVRLLTHPESFENAAALCLAEMELNRRGICDKCYESFATHNDDGSCIEPEREVEP